MDYDVAKSAKTYEGVQKQRVMQDRNQGANYEKKSQSFEKGLNTDVSAAFQPDGTYRDAINMELTSFGDQNVINQIKSALEISSQEIVSGGNITAVNILGYTPSKALNTSGVIVDGFVVYVLGRVSSNEPQCGIYFFEQSGNSETGTIHLVSNDSNLFFPETGSIDSFFTQINDKMEVFFTDFNNEIRSITMKMNLWPLSATQLSAQSLSLGTSRISVTSIGGDGSLLAGTYQFSFRLRNSLTLRYTDWSVFTNPIPIIPQSYTTGSTNAYYGGNAGYPTTRSISFTVPRSALETSAYYDIVDIATIKNNDGSYTEQTLAYISSINNTPASGNLTIMYSGSESESTLPISEIVVPDVAINTVKTIVEKDGRIIAGNIKYYDRRVLDSEASVTDARTIRVAVDYQDPINTEKYRGYWRDEVYRFGVTYHDKFGNWSPVKPLNFATFNKRDRTSSSGTTCTIATGAGNGINYDRNTLTLQAASNWDTSKYFAGGSALFRNVMVSGISFPDFTSDIISVATTALTVLVPAKMWANNDDFQSSGATGSMTAFPLKGNNYNHSSDNFTWKFPKREHIGVTSTGATGTYGTYEHGTYSLLTTTGAGITAAQAIGLGVTITNHPSWAVGMAIVRMERDKDIIYQSPIIPASLSVGNITPGKNLGAPVSTLDYQVINGVGELDHLSPKVLKLGAARNMEILTIKTSSYASGNTTAYADVYQLPSYQPLNSVPENRLMWKKCFFPAVDYVYNYLGTPLVATPDGENKKVEIIDVCGFKLSNLTPIDPITTVTQTGGMSVTKPSGYVEARIYQCDTPALHWYNNASGYTNMRTQTATGVSGNYEETKWRKINESILVANGVYSSSYVGSNKRANIQTRLSSNGADKYIYATTLMDLDNLFTTESVIPIPKGSPKILLNVPEKGAGGQSTRSAAEYLIAGEELTNQQKNSSIDSSDTQSINLFSSGIDYQRNLALTLNQPLDDPLYMLTAHYSSEGVGQFGVIPRDPSSPGTTGTMATVPFAGYLNNYNPGGPSGNKELRNGLIHANPFMNITYNGSVLPTGTTPEGLISFPYLIPSLPINPSNSRIYYAPIENVDAGVHYGYTGGNTTTSWIKVANSTGDVQQALYVANLRNGKSDFRYGDPNSIDEYIFTGAYAKIAATGTPISLSVWGGDCFVSKYRYKVNDEYNMPAYYKPTPSGTYGLDFDLRGRCTSFDSTGVVASIKAFKTGIKKSPEYIELYMESEANAFYNSEENRYPYFNAVTATAGTESQYQADAFYDYNPGYSIQNLPKKFFSENRNITKSEFYPARVVYSDKRSENSVYDGFSRFRLESFYDIGEKYGKISRIVLLGGDNSVIVGQDNAISLLYVNKSLTTLQDNNSLAVQSGVYISEETPPKYFTTNYGAELLRCMISTESGVYVLDTKKGTLLSISDQLKILPLGRMEEYFRFNFSNSDFPWKENEIQLSYDSVEKTLYIIGGILINNQYPKKDNFQWLSYNAKIDSFISRLSWSINGQGHGGKYYNRPYFHFDLNGTTYVIQSHSPNNAHDAIDFHVNKWKGDSGFLKLLTGQHIKEVDASIEYVINHNKEEPKVIDIVGINGQSPFSSFEVEVYNDTSGFNPLDTGVKTTNINNRFGMSSTAFLRDAATNRRLTGTYGVVKLTFSSAISKLISIKTAFTQFRKLLRW